MSRIITASKSYESSDDWATPKYIFDALNDIFDFQVDVCADALNAKCRTYFDIADNGLKQDWYPHRCFMNPPYGRKGPGEWLEKALFESERGAHVVALVKAATDATWWHTYAMRAAEIWFVHRRVNFIPPKDKKSSTNNHGSNILVFPPRSREVIELVRPKMKTWHPPIKDKWSELLDGV